MKLSRYFAVNVLGALFLIALEPAFSLKLFSGNLRIFSGSNKCLNIPSNNQSNGQPVQQGNCDGSDQQKFKFYPLPLNDGYHNITSTENLCLDVINNDKSNGTIVDIRTCNGQENQKWLVNDLGMNLFHLKPAHAIDQNMCLDNQYGSSDIGSQIEIWSCKSNPASQSWSIAVPGVLGNVILYILDVINVNIVS